MDARRICLPGLVNFLVAPNQKFAENYVHNRSGVIVYPKKISKFDLMCSGKLGC